MLLMFQENSSKHSLKCLKTIAEEFTVIRFIFVVFVHRKRMKIFYTNIILQRKFNLMLVGSGYTPALPELLLPIYPCIHGSL